MPKKEDNVVFCPLTPKQKKVYRRFLAEDEVQLMLKKDDPCDCDSGKKFVKAIYVRLSFVIRRGKCCHPFPSDAIFKYLQIFLKVSNHLALILPGWLPFHDKCVFDALKGAVMKPTPSVP